MPQQPIAPLWEQGPQPNRPPAGPMDIFLPRDNVIPFGIDQATGAQQTLLDDGSMIIDFEPWRERQKSDKHDANIAMEMSDSELDLIAADLLEGIEHDDASRSTWMANRTRGLDLLGLKLEDPRSDLGASSAPLEGMSTVRHPLLLEAVLRFQANERGELLPAEGPVKVSDDGDGSAQSDEDAKLLEDEMNYYYTVTASEYVPDTDRLLFILGFGGAMFKKVYICPLRNRPVSESVDAADLIVSNATTDLGNAGRVTHRIKMRPSVMKRMQILGIYRDVPLVEPEPENDQMERKVNELQGTEPQTFRPQDRDRTLYECYCELDIPGYEHKKDGKETGLPIPYRVTIDVASRKILEIRRNWSEDDEDYRAKETFVPYVFVPGLGFYGLGLLNILGNTESALTAAWRLMLDAGMFANFPGFLFLKNGESRQKNNQFRVPPGGGAPVDGGGMDDIRKSIMPLPYKEPGPSMAAFVADMGQQGRGLGGTAEIAVGDGRQDAPVGTTLALLEQAVQIMSAVHKRLCTAQAKEFQLMRDLFLQIPEALVRKDKPRPGWDMQRVLRALKNFNLTPRADPNTPSHMHRLIKALGIKQLASSNPEQYDQRKVDSRIMRMMGIDDPEDMFAPPPPPMDPAMMLPPPDPVKMRELDIREQESVSDLQLRAVELQKNFELELQKLNQKSNEMKDKEDIEVLRFAASVASNPEGEDEANRAVKIGKATVKG